MKNKFEVQENSKKRKREESRPSLGLGVYITENHKKYERPQVVEDDEEIIIDKELVWTLRVGKAINPQTKEENFQVFTEYKDVFAYRPQKCQGSTLKSCATNSTSRRGFKSIKQKIR